MRECVRRGVRCAHELLTCTVQRAPDTLGHPSSKAPLRVRERRSPTYIGQVAQNAAMILQAALQHRGVGLHAVSKVVLTVVQPEEGASGQVQGLVKAHGRRGWGVRSVHAQGWVCGGGWGRAVRPGPAHATHIMSGAVNRCRMGVYTARPQAMPSMQ